MIVRLPARPDAPRKARQSLRQACADVAGHLLYDAELLTSEIVSSVVMHVGGMLTVAIECDERMLAVAVATSHRAGRCCVAPRQKTSAVAGCRLCIGLPRNGVVTDSPTTPARSSGFGSRFSKDKPSHR
jgi:hypothetical protein